ncbi:hypothetical protein ACSFA8_14730 [Variovorax sp. RT4R15]|uniref:hypothetical protein n=1 Tax=Variovorax sp. RT4R15 TaxID=3443737 RepID=UPI003F466385
MEELKASHRYAVLCHLSGKVEELQYQLSEVLARCDTSLSRFQTGQAAPMFEQRQVCYSFSAFANVLQTLKDIAKDLLGDNNPGESLRALRHGAFILDSRNAMTHDGHPIVDAWVDGRFHVAADIYRFNKGTLVTIQAPSQDIRTVCLEFTADLCIYLRGLLEAKRAEPAIEHPLPDFTRIEQALTSSIVPEFARALFADQREEVRASLLSFRPDPLDAACRSADSLADYCARAMKSALV